MQSHIKNLFQLLNTRYLNTIFHKLEFLKPDPEKLKAFQNPLEQSVIFLMIFALACGGAEADAAVANASNLKAKHVELANQLKNNQFNRELYILSSETDTNLKGEIYAVVNYPFATVNKGLNDASHWCDVLILHINIKYCYAQPGSDNTVLTVDLGKKYEQALDDTYRIDFNYQQVASAADYFALALDAKDGPLGTRDYRILVEATPLDAKRSFLHFTYTYSFGLKGRVAMKTYLATTGREKVGFTKVKNSGASNEDNTAYIQGVRGVIERNTMRYYLAIDAYLSSQQQEKRFANWYDSTAQYSRQLKEVERDDYLAMKRKEYQRQQTRQ
jgi:hypothetical protein